MIYMAHAGLLTKNTTLSYATTSTGSFTALPNLTSIPQLGGTPNTIDTTTLDDSAHTYIQGLVDFGDTIEIEFIFDADQTSSTYNMITALAQAETYFKLEIPDPSSTSSSALATATFSGQPRVSLGEIGVDAALTAVLQITLTSEVTWA